jgi:DNA end-binding protein Ku
MAPRTFWKGYLKLSLVTCPVAMMPATTTAERVRFHTINAKTGNRIRSQYVDADSGKPVDEEEQIKGVESGDNRLVMLEEDELDAVALETTHTIDIEKFVPRESINAIWLDTPHYLLPDDEVGQDAYIVIRDAMEETNMVGVSRLVLYRRERPIIVAPRGAGMLVWTLRQANEVRDASNYFSGIKTGPVPADMMKLAQTLISERTVPWEKSLLTDRLQKDLLALIDAKKKGKKPPKPKAEPKSDGKVISIMDALKRSVEQEKRRR